MHVFPAKLQKLHSVNGLTIIFAPNLLTMVLNINSSEELQTLINQAENLLIYFYSNDCAPCRSLRPKVEELVRDSFPLMDMIYIDGREFPELAAEYNAFGFPVLIFIFEGKEFLRYSKYVSIAELKESIGRIYTLYHQRN